MLSAILDVQVKGEENLEVEEITCKQEARRWWYHEGECYWTTSQISDTDFRLNMTHKTKAFVYHNGSKRIFQRYGLTKEKRLGRKNDNRKAMSSILEAGKETGIQREITHQQAPRVHKTTNQHCGISLWNEWTRTTKHLRKAFNSKRQTKANMNNSNIRDNGRRRTPHVTLKRYCNLETQTITRKLGVYLENIK